MSFDYFRLHPTLNANLKGLRFINPTPIQKQAIPHVMAHKDVLGLAQTGTGKTAAFGLPILHRLISGPRNKIRALVIAPTRELAEQIHEAFGAMGKGTGLRSATVYGGVGMHKQVNNLRGRCEIVVACPGRLLDHMDRRNADFSKLEILVLDEADQMFDMGFIPDVRKILRKIPDRRQTLLFAATMPPDIRKLTHECLREPVTVQVDHTKPLATVSHALYPVNQHLKAVLLLEILKRTATGSVLVFTRTKHRAKALDKKLNNAGFVAASLQGNLSQSRRKVVMDGFRSGKFDILVATDIASRGIDVSEISHVINYDIPSTPDTYVHRIGRTGRAAKTGDAYTLITREDEEMIRLIEKRMGRNIERRRIESFDYNQAGAPNPQGRGRHHKHHRHGQKPHRQDEKPHSKSRHSPQPGGHRNFNRSGSHHRRY
ncbi:DEAD/DEAH box helicase [Elusimicrobiota bacterium]